jgi:hypothetical protein
VASAGRWLLGTMAGALLGSLVSFAGPASYADSGTSQADRELADRYAPIVMVRKYDPPCGDGEPYVPMRVDPVLGNPEVALRQVGNGDPVIRWAPTAGDLYGLGGGTYLDLPGDALSPGCLYARDSARYTPPDRSAVYGHVVQQANRPGYVAVQYWLYWYYNDWNDRHESDWEFIQVLFRADSAQEALSTDPVSVGYAQHTGGETHEWDSPDLQREDTHPVVYSSEGSHASYFAPALFLGRAASEGFGCDNTQEPSTRLTPTVVLLPDKPSGPDSRFAWLAYGGRWGERHPGPQNGPDGPMGKPRWTKPVDWADDLRASSFEIPGGSDTPPAVVGTFCTVVGQGSVVYLKFVADPARVFTVLVLLVLALVLILRRTSWSAVPALPIARRRRAGQIVRASLRIFRRHPLAFVTTGLLAVPVGLLASAVTAVIVHLPFLGDAIEVSTDQPGDTGPQALVSSAVGASLWPVTVLLVSAAVVHLMEGDGPESSRWTFGAALGAIREVGRRLRDLASAFVPAAVAIVLLDLLVFGVPIAAWLTVRYQFVGQAVMTEDLRGGAARRRSSTLVRHRWWHTAMFAFLIWTGIHAVGVLLGLLLLITVTSAPLWTVSLVVLVAEVALTPVGAIALTLLYGDARVEHDTVSVDDDAVAVG